MRDAINNKHTYASLKNREIFLGIQFYNIQYYSFPKKAKSALKPQGDERAGEIHGYTVAEQRYPWAKVPQAHLHLLGLLSRVFFLPHKIAKKLTYTLTMKAFRRDKEV